MIFEDLNLNKPVLNALADLEYFYPTPIQKEAFSVVMSGRNVIGIAQTGTGKTFAYLLPILRMLPYSNQREPRVLILAPTHELVLQILDELQKLTKYMSTRSLGIIGGANMGKQKEAIYDGTDVIVATPGRLLDLAYTGVLGLKSIQKLVIDEVDEMLSLGFRTQLNNLFDMLPKKRQNLMFSATLTEEVNTLISNSFYNAQKIEIQPHGTPLDKIIQQVYRVPNFNTKVNLLEYLLNNSEDMTKVLVFVKTKKMADRLFEKMQLKFPAQCGVIHSNKAHNTRLNAVKKFQEGTHRFIIATDIIARGMDITDVSHIINFDLSENSGDYLHRIGRTGRADKEGVAISFVNEVEEKYLTSIEQLMKIEIAKIILPTEVVVSSIFDDDDKPKQVVSKKFIKEPRLTNPKGAFHEKSEKNKKVNSGSPSKKKKVYSKSGKLKYKPGKRR